MHVFYPAFQHEAAFVKHGAFAKQQLIVLTSLYWFLSPCSAWLTLGGYPDTTTKTLKHESSRENETKIASMDDRNNRKAKELRYALYPYIPLFPYCAFPALKYPGER